jgi:glutaconate CoA-transferase subunit B
MDAEERTGGTLDGGDPMNYTASEIMTVAASRTLTNDDICFVGIGLPSAACNLARLTHAPRITLIYESGPVATTPNVLPLSIGDGELCHTAMTTVSIPEIFRYWLQGGRITVGFLGGAQVDRFGNLNSTVVGSYNHPKIRLPGSGGACEIGTSCGRTYIVMNQSARSFVTNIDFITTLGHGRTGTERKQLGVSTRGPALLVTDLCIMEPDPESNEFEVVSVHPGVTQDRLQQATGWPVKFANRVKETEPPSSAELDTLRALHERTQLAHAKSKGVFHESG